MPSVKWIICCNLGMILRVYPDKHSGENTNVEYNYELGLFLSNCGARVPFIKIVWGPS